MTPWLDDGDIRLYHGDALETVRAMPDESVDCVVTSPPYWGLRDYGINGQMGLEETPDLFVHNMVELFREIRRVLAPHGTCWVNLGDSYVSNGFFPDAPLNLENAAGLTRGAKSMSQRGKQITSAPGLKPKDLCGIPWRVAFALQADGWWLRSDIIWAKPNPMPESVTDRPTKAHEYVFLLTKQPRYWFDTEAVREPAEYGFRPTKNGNIFDRVGSAGSSPEKTPGVITHGGDPSAGRNVRSVWQIATQPYPEAHFATYPEELARRCILAGCPVRVCRVCGKPSERIVDVTYTPGGAGGGSGHIGDANKGSSMGEKVRHERVMPDRMTKHAETVGWSDCGHNNWRPGTVLDPFIGSGTTAKAARDHQRHAIGIDLNVRYLELAARRLQQLSLLT